MTMTFTTEIKAKAFDLRTIPGLDKDGYLDAYLFFTSNAFSNVSLPDYIDPDDAPAVISWAMGFTFDYNAEEIDIPSYFNDEGNLVFWAQNHQGLGRMAMLLSEMYPNTLFATLNKVDSTVDYVGASIYDNNGMQTTTGFDVYRNPSIEDKALAFFETITL